MNFKCAAALLFLAAFTGQAHAETIDWHSLPPDADRIEFFGMVRNEVEGDTVLRVVCVPGGKIQVSVGAYKDIGTGKRGLLSVTLKSGDVSVTLKGKPAESDNVEMTGASELRTEPFPISDNRLLALFETKKPITVTGALKATWTVRSVEKLARDFAKSCSRGYLIARHYCFRPEP